MKKNNLQPLASFIRNHRISLKFSQTDIAVALGIEQSAYHRKETGVSHFKPEELKSLAELFHISTWEFYCVQTGEEEFVQFARSKGFIPERSCHEELEVLRNKVQSLQENVLRLQAQNERLEKDKQFLRSMLKNEHIVKNNNGGGVKLRRRFKQHRKDIKITMRLGTLFPNRYAHFS